MSYCRHHGQDVRRTAHRWCILVCRSPKVQFRHRLLRKRVELQRADEMQCQPGTAGDRQTAAGFSCELLRR